MPGSRTSRGGPMIRSLRVAPPPELVLRGFDSIAGEFRMLELPN
jgi:hypothetical protein